MFQWLKKILIVDNVLMVEEIPIVENVPMVEEIWIVEMFKKLKKYLIVNHKNIFYQIGHLMMALLWN